jgi:hypothetical protein
MGWGVSGDAMGDWGKIVSHWLGMTAQKVSVFLTSGLGHRIEALIVGVLLLALSIFLAQYFGRTVDLPYRQLSGAKLKHVEDAEKRTARLKKLRSHRRGFTGLLARSLALFTTFAFVVPSAVLATGIYFYSWFFPSAEALTQEVGCNLWSATHPSLAMLSEFMLSQFSMGFGHSLELLAYNNQTLSTAGALNPTNGGVGMALIGYRYFVAGFAGLFVRFVWRIISLFRSITPEEQSLVAMG